MEMTASIFMAKMLVPDCGRMRLRLAHFQDSSGKHRGAPAREAPRDGLDDAQFHRMHSGEDALSACSIKPVHALQQPREHRPIVGQDRVVAVLEEVGLVDLDLGPKDAAAVDAAPHHPIAAAVAVVGAVVTVFPESPPELGDHDDHRIAPALRTDLFRETDERTAKFTETVGEIAVGGALVDVGIPATDIDKTQIELLAHEAADPPRRQLEAA